MHDTSDRRLSRTGCVTYGAAQWYLAASIAWHSRSSRAGGSSVVLGMSVWLRRLNQGCGRHLRTGLTGDPWGAPVSTRCNAASSAEAFLQYKNGFGSRQEAAAHKTFFKVAVAIDVALRAGLTALADGEEEKDF